MPTSTMLKFVYTWILLHLLHEDFFDFDKPSQKLFDHTSIIQSDTCSFSTYIFLTPRHFHNLLVMLGCCAGFGNQFSVGFDIPSWIFEAGFQSLVYRMRLQVPMSINLWNKLSSRFFDTSRRNFRFILVHPSKFGNAFMVGPLLLFQYLLWDFELFDDQGTTILNILLNLNFITSFIIRKKTNQNVSFNLLGCSVKNFIKL